MQTAQGARALCCVVGIVVGREADSALLSPLPTPIHLHQGLSGITLTPSANWFTWRPICPVKSIALRVCLYLSSINTDAQCLLSACWCSYSYSLRQRSSLLDGVVQLWLLSPRDHSLPLSSNTVDVSWLRYTSQHRQREHHHQTTSSTKLKLPYCLCLESSESVFCL